MGAERELRRLANELNTHRFATDWSTWHWYPGRREPSQSSPGIHLLLVDGTITLYDTRQDWLELTLDIAWLEAPKFTVNAAIDVLVQAKPQHASGPHRAVARR